MGIGLRDFDRPREHGVAVSAFDTGSLKYLRLPDCVSENNLVAVNVQPAVLHPPVREWFGDTLRLYGPIALEVRPTGPLGLAEYHLTLRRRRVHEAEAAVAVVQVATGPRGREAHRAAVEHHTGITLLAEFHNSRFENCFVPFAQRVAHRAVQERSGVHLTKAGIDPVRVHRLFPRLGLARGGSRGPIRQRRVEGRSRRRGFGWGGGDRSGNKSERDDKRDEEQRGAHQYHLASHDRDDNTLGI